MNPTHVSDSSATGRRRLELLLLGTALLIGFGLPIARVGGNYCAREARPELVFPNVPPVSAGQVPTLLDAFVLLPGLAGLAVVILAFVSPGTFRALALVALGLLLPIVVLLRGDATGAYLLAMLLWTDSVPGSALAVSALGFAVMIAGCRATWYRANGLSGPRLAALGAVLYVTSLFLPFNGDPMRGEGLESAMAAFFQDSEPYFEGRGWLHAWPYCWGLYNQIPSLRVEGSRFAQIVRSLYVEDEFWMGILRAGSALCAGVASFTSLALFARPEEALGKARARRALLWLTVATAIGAALSVTLCRSIFSDPSPNWHTAASLLLPCKVGLWLGGLVLVLAAGISELAIGSQSGAPRIPSAASDQNGCAEDGVGASHR